ncbi:MAG: hypothetical protein WA902_11395, partial [Thermosynechococcaceae cyanobacterium]
MQDLSSTNNLPLEDLEDSGTDLEELRSLLLGPELTDRIMNLKLRPEDVSRVLAESIVLSGEQQ